MIKGDFEIIIASSPEREKVFCEIYYKNEFVCDISQENEELTLGLYGPLENPIFIPFREFQEILEVAKKHLLNGLSNQ